LKAHKELVFCEEQPRGEEKKGAKFLSSQDGIKKEYDYDDDRYGY